MKTTHTPTPWTIKHYGFIGLHGTEYSQVSRENEKDCIFIFKTNEPEGEANAAHIVKCVNLHEDLVFSLEYCYRKLNKLVESGKISEPLLLDEVPELLKRAKGEA
jgi:hypothetical protein